MTHARQHSEARPKNGLGSMLALSLALHLVLFFLSMKLDLFRNDITVEQAIYVDVVNLPVASPQAGSPAGSEKTPGGTGTPPALVPPPPAPREMKLPAPRTTPAKTPTDTRKANGTESAREYEARLAALEQAAEARRQEAVLNDIRNRLASRNAGSGPAGIPGGTGTQAGSDYASYIQSRLRDSFAQTIAWQTRKPMVAVRLTIDAKGGIASYKIEKSTGDAVFEDAVFRAVQLARKNFPPPPTGKEFSYGFVFKPEGVDKK